MPKEGTLFISDQVAYTVTLEDALTLCRAKLAELRRLEREHPAR